MKTTELHRIRGNFRTILIFSIFFCLHTAYAKLLLKKDSECAPPLWRSELRNVIAGYICRNLMTIETEVQVMGEAESRM